MLKFGRSGAPKESQQWHTNRWKVIRKKGVGSFRKESQNPAEAGHG